MMVNQCFLTFLLLSEWHFFMGKMKLCFPVILLCIYVCTFDPFLYIKLGFPLVSWKISISRYQHGNDPVLATYLTYLYNKDQKLLQWYILIVQFIPQRLGIPWEPPQGMMKSRDGTLASEPQTPSPPLPTHHIAALCVLHSVLPGVIWRYFESFNRQFIKLGREYKNTLGDKTLYSHKINI